tara:strand:- start:79 stop:642 length:564 start_codon:yes stop_codon:yes gene_type:complete
MKFSTACLSFLLTSIVLLSTGCESNGIANRINEKSATFAALSPEEKEYIEDGLIYPGYTKDMTYMAVGKPNSTETIDKDGQNAEMWTYKRFYPSGRLEMILTDYSRARNPNLQRSVDIETGKATVSDHAPTSGAPTRSSSSIGGASGTSGQMNNLSLPDVPVYNLYIIFLEGKIVDLRLESLDGTPL